MKVTERYLKRLIKEEIANVKRVRRSRSDRVVTVTPSYLNQIIKEEYSNFKKDQRLIEAKRRRRLASRRSYR